MYIYISILQLTSECLSEIQNTYMHAGGSIKKKKKKIIILTFMHAVAELSSWFLWIWGLITGFRRTFIGYFVK